MLADRCRKVTATKQPSANVSPVSLVINNCTAPWYKPSPTGRNGVSASEGSELLQRETLPELWFHTNIFLLKILKASCDFVKGGILTKDFNEASSFLESKE